MGGIVPCDNMHVSRLEETLHKNNMHLFLLLIQARKADAWQGPHALQCVKERHAAFSSQPLQHPFSEASPCGSSIMRAAGKLQLPVISELLPSLLNLLSHLSQPCAASWPQAVAANPPRGVMKSLLPSCERRHLAPMCGHCGDGGGGQTTDRSALN